ncbi:MAG: UDP-N-acetylmuramate dehydrogenase [Gemmataceae bacterium]
MPRLSEFEAIIRRNETLAPYTLLRLGGPAEMLLQPRSLDELSAVVKRCYEENIPLRVLGSGCNMLIRDEGVAGAVLRLSEPAFTQIRVEGQTIHAGTGASVSALISAAAREGLAGLETLVGIPGTIGGAIRTNAGDRAGDIGQFVRSVEVLDSRGTTQSRGREELRFGEHASNLDDPVLLSVEFALERDQPEAIVRRMRKAWISRKARQPATFQAAGRIFKDPRGLNASGLIEQAGLARTRVGGAEVSETEPNYILIHPGTRSADVLRLIELMKVRVRERFNVNLEQEIAVW